MDSLLNSSRPPVFCPGCAHDRVVKALDLAFRRMGLEGNRIVIVSDIGCSGLFDTFFNTHAFHGLHGRALTYATGIKMARPDLTVVVTMGDGGLGIGGAHLISTCRRNIDLTLLVLNNFNYGMTGGQCSSTTPQDAQVASGFLNRLEKPIDLCQLAGTAGAGRVARLSSYQSDLPEQIAAAVAFEGFSVLDIHGICTGRFTRRNRISPSSIAASLERLPPVDHFESANRRMEYGRHYRETAVGLPPEPPPAGIGPRFTPPGAGRREVVICGSAGQRVVTAGEILCLSGIFAGLHASQKNDYPITVLQGHSISEVILSEHAIGYTGIEKPSVVVALAQEGIDRRRSLLGALDRDALVIQAAGSELPPCNGRIAPIDFRALKVKSGDWALCALALLARENRMLNREMLAAALAFRFKGQTLQDALALLEIMQRVDLPPLSAPAP